MSYYNNHTHTEYSNLRLKDCNMKVEAVIKKAVSLGLNGVSITDHECLSGHITAIQEVKKLREKGIDFKVGLGNEIYLVNSLEEVREEYQSGVTKFPHFVLVAKDAIGHRALRELSSIAWENLFRTGLMERVCVDTNSLVEIMGKYRGHVIASSACIGGYIGNQFLQYSVTKNPKCLQDIDVFVNACKVVFGEDFYLEIQPSFMQEQIEYNKFLLTLSEKHRVKLIYTTDAHYLSKDHRQVHKSFLLSKDGDREDIDIFYSSTYLMGIDEVWEYFKEYIPLGKFEEMTANTNELSNKIEFYDLQNEVVVPETVIPPFNQNHALFNIKGYEYIEKFATSEHVMDRYLLFEIAQGLKEKKIDINNIYLDRINIELKEIWLISKKLNQQLSAYYVLVKDVVDLMWTLSVVGVARGSVTGYLITYLIGIIQMNPLQYNLPHWRHLTSDRPELPDIDIDTESDKRQQIFEAMKDKYGHHRVLNIITFKTEKAKSAILTAGRGLGYNVDEIQAIADMIPVERGQQWGLNECIHGDGEEKKPIKELIDILEQYPNLLETALDIENIVVGRSIHASGVYIFKGHYIEQNSLMKAPNGNYVTCWNMTDSDYCGCLKVDCLTIEALDRIRTCMELLIKEGKIQWKGSLRQTYDEYIHPDKLEFKSKEMWDLLYQGHITNAFQYETEVGQQALRKINPTSFIEIVNGNSLMRLSCDGVQPLDKYVNFKSDISKWYDEMISYGLDEREIEVLEKHLKELYGVADTQEVVMELSMDQKIASFTLGEANKLRKGIAKKKKKVIEEVRTLFFEKGQSNGSRYEILNYVWEAQIVPQLGYSFSKNHTNPYSMILMQEMNLAYQYGHMYWKCACLSVNAGAIGEGKSVEYGKIAKAVSDMRDIVDLPLINNADREFSIMDDKILFGFRGLSKVGDGVIEEIISHRPYTSFEDYLEKVGNSIKVESNISLIKAGCFNEFGDRTEIMKNYIIRIANKKESLSVANIPLLQELGLIPERYSEELRIYHMYKTICSKQNLKTKGRSDSTTWYYIPDTLLDQFLYTFDELKEGTHYKLCESKELYTVSKSRIKASMDKSIAGLTDFLKSKELAESVNQIELYNTWEKYCKGSVERWEMDSMGFYKQGHELDAVDKKRYNIENYFQLPESPVLGEIVKYRGKEFNRYKLSLIMGTVLDRNKTKHTVTLLTTEGVVTCKLYDGSFRHYDKIISKVGSDGKKVRIEESWFKKGSMVLMYGFRLGDQFRPRKYSNSIFQHTVMKINGVNADGTLIVQEERVRV